MKRLFLFVLLFGGGLFLLNYLSREQKERQRERVEQERLATQQREETRAQKPPSVAPEAAPSSAEPPPSRSSEEGLQFTVGGELVFNIWEQEEPHNLIYEVEFRDVEPRNESEYDVTGLTIRAFDTGTEELQTTFEALEGVVHIQRTAGTWTIGGSHPVQLTDVTVTLHQGSPMAPMTLKLPSAQLDTEKGNLFSDERVKLFGDGITGKGRGLELLERGKTMKLLREGVLTLQADESTTLELVASETSSINLKRLPLREDLERIEVRLPAGGELVSQGKTPFRVRADELTLDGRVIYVEKKTTEATTRHREMRAEHAQLVGGVEVRRESQRMSGGQGEIFFDALGEFRRLHLEDQPLVWGALELSSNDPGEPQRVDFELGGEGPMEITYNATSPAAQFDVRGPSSIEVEAMDLRLDAQQGIGGNFWGRGLANANLRGPVTGHYEDNSLEGQDLSIRGRQAEDGTQHLFFETQRPAHIQGTDAKGERVDVRSGGTLNLVLKRQALEVVLAKVVDITWAGEQPLSASMGEIRELDIKSGAFLASQGVHYTSLFGTGSATRATGHSFEHLELFGEPQAPATYNLDPQTSGELKQGLLRAQHLDLRRTHAEADGDVQLRFKGQEMRQEIDCDQLTLDMLAERDGGQPTPFQFEARGVTRALIVKGGAKNTLVADMVSGQGTITRFAEEERPSSFELVELKAQGKVEVSYKGQAGDFRARGGTVTWSNTGRGRLEALAGQRVEARGRFEGEGLPYLWTAAWIEYGEEEIQALFPEITLDRPAALPLLLSGRGGTELYSGSADWLTSDMTGLLLAGNAHFSGKTKEGNQLKLDAGSMHLTRSAATGQQDLGVDELVAWDGFRFELEDDLVGTGEILQAGYEVLRLEGRPARLDVHGFVWEASNVVYDVPRVLITTDQGRLFGAPGSGSEGWVANYESLQPFEGEDSTMMVMRNLNIQSGTREIHADWATFWLDREEWQRKTREWIEGVEEVEEEPPLVPAGPEPVDEADQAPTLFGQFDSTALSKVLKELYLEGGVEILDAGQRRAQMQALYIDMVDGHGWIQGCELFMDIKIRRVQTELIVRADWLRHSSDGSLSADKARVTACGHAVPHYYIETKNLRMKPIDAFSSGWDILMKNNALVFDNGLSLPLPRVHYKSDGKGRPTLGALRFGDSARYGTFVEASADVDVGESLSKLVAPVLNAEPEEIDGRYRLRASYYASRGLLLDQRFKLTAADHFWMKVSLNGLYDSGKDRGLLRSQGPGESDLRWLLAIQSRYSLSSKEWFDFALADQHDAGFQAEFLERQFIRYERRDNFLRWRKAQEQHYYSANVRYRIDDFRNEVERLPDLGYMRGLTPVGKLWGQPLLYSATADVAYLRMRQARGSVISPFDPSFDPALGNRDVLRADTRHRLERPLEVGIMGLRASPYVELVGSAWSEGVNSQDTPTRATAIAGLEAQATYYRTWGKGVVNSVTPFIGVHGDFASFEQGGVPLQLDELDESVEGGFLDLGLRSRWRQPGGARYLDTSVRASHRGGLNSALDQGWAPVQVLGELLAVYKGIPYAITHDAKYDLDDGDTMHSSTSFSFLPHYNLGLEVGLNRGLDQERNVLFNAISYGARWNATPKWQLEARQSVSKLDNSALSSDFLVRRLGHDFIFDLGYSFRSGEGGNTLTFKYRPRLSWREPSFGRMQALQRARL